MKRVLVGIILMAGLIVLTGSAGADDTAPVYKAKCLSCHAADGTGTPIGKKMGARDFHDPEVAKQTDQQLNDAIVKGKKKMPKYEGKLTADQIKQLVTYVRDLGKKK
ncbi:MAG: c-type cytochrome [Terriglobales bacterium]